MIKSYGMSYGNSANISLYNGVNQDLTWQYLLKLMVIIGSYLSKVSFIATMQFYHQVTVKHLLNACHLRNDIILCYTNSTINFIHEDCYYILKK